MWILGVLFIVSGQWKQWGCGNRCHFLLGWRCLKRGGKNRESWPESYRARCFQMSGSVGSVVHERGHHQLCFSGRRRRKEMHWFPFLVVSGSRRSRSRNPHSLARRGGCGCHGRFWREFWREQSEVRVVVHGALSFDSGWRCNLKCHCFVRHLWLCFLVMDFSKCRCN